MIYSVMEEISINQIHSIENFPFDVLEIKGDDSIDFLHRMSTNDFSNFHAGSIQKTLFISDKGRIIDTVWVIYDIDRILILVSLGMSKEIISWLNRYIITDDVEIADVSDLYSISVNFLDSSDNAGFQTDYFSFPVWFTVTNDSLQSMKGFPLGFEQWRIWNGIPVSKKELHPDFNPLELHLWNWISFTKGCYIGQEVIARLETYNKIQKEVVRFKTDQYVMENEILLNENGTTSGRITSVTKVGEKYIGLAIVKKVPQSESISMKTKNKEFLITLEPLLRKEYYGRS